MQYKISIILSLIFLISIPSYVNDAFGHGLGMDQAMPVNFAGMDVTIFTRLDPRDLTVGEVDKANLGIRFFDLKTDQNLSKVTYQVEVWRSGELLVRDTFYDPEGDLSVEIRPKLDCNQTEKWKCAQVYGEVEPILGGKFARGDSKPVITGPIFDKGGLYQIKAEIISAQSPKQLVAERLIFNTFVSVAEEYDFLVKTAHAEEFPVSVKTYYDDIKNFKFDNSDNSIYFDMPFNWDPNYLNTVKVVHEEIRIPQSFDPYNEGNHLKGFVNGVEIANSALVLDPYSYEDANVVHFLVTGQELKRINDVLDSDNKQQKTISFKLTPQGKIEKNSFDLKFDSGVTAIVEWPTTFGAGDTIPFNIAFLSPEGDLLTDMRYGYEILDKNGKLLTKNMGTDSQNPGIHAMEGIDTQTIKIPSQDLYNMRLVIIGQGIGISTNTKYSSMSNTFFEVGPSKQTSFKEVSIPNWVRNNAAWWSEGKISDKDFSSGIQFMIKEGIIRIPTTENGQANQNVKIPDWVRNNAAWWSEGKISDKDFSSGIQHLIKIGIISV